MTIKLYTLCGADRQRPFSPHAWKVAMALAHKGLAFEEVPTPFTAIPAIEGGATKTVPLIVDGGRTVSDSFLIAAYLEEAYPDRPSLFGGAGGEAMARFIEAWGNAVLHGALARIILRDIHDCLDEADQAYFRESREKRFGKPLEEVVADRAEAIAAFPGLLQPLRLTLSKQPWLGGAAPLFADYIVFGGLQWARVVSSQSFLANDDPVSEWFERCLGLHGGIGRAVKAAAA